MASQVKHQIRNLRDERKIVHHSLINDIAAVITKDVSQALELPPPTDKQDVGDNISVKIVYSGPKPEQIDWVMERLRRLSNPVNLIDLLKNNANL